MGDNSRYRCDALQTAGPVLATPEPCAVPEGGTELTETTDTQVAHRRRSTLVWLAITGLILSLVVAAPAFAAHTGPLVTPDTDTYDTPPKINPDCAELVADGLITGFDDEDKSGDSPDGGPIDLGNSSITVTGEEVSFQAEDGWLVVAAIIKGGNEGAAVYVYEGFGGADGVDHDNGLITPTEQGVSHVTLCLIEEEVESESPSVPGESESPEGSVGGGTGTPAGSVPDTATSLPGFGGPLATLIFGAILVASLGTLAYANVRAAKQRQ